MSLPEQLQLTPRELASGYVFGYHGHKAPLPARSERSPREVLEDSVRRALEASPCVITFSGGRDSSALLALAVHIARRDGLPLPVAATSRYPAAPATDESSWQERVVRHLRLEDWVRLEHTDELDILGPVATGILSRRGLLWPANSHLLAPHAHAAAGGVVVTGTGGDQLFDPSRLARHAALLTGAVRPSLRDVRRLAFAVAPTPARRALVRYRFPNPAPCPWLLPEAQRWVTAGWQAETAAEPIRPSARPGWFRRLRAFSMALSSLDIVAEDSGTRMVHPFLEPEFLVAVANHRLPLFDRGEAMRAIFGDLLPDDVLDRRTKPMFEEPLWNRHSREFAKQAPVERVDTTLVDPDRLRSFWADSGGASRFRSASILQHLWLEESRRLSSGDEVEERGSRRLEAAPPLGPAELEGR